MIILFGLAGSGKGTQGKALSEIFGWRALSVGQVIRDTDEYADVINNGNLIPDEDVIRLMTKQIEKSEAEGFDVILDGYPRTEYQAKWLVDHMSDKIDGAIILEVPKEELYERLSLRGRDDDKEKESIDRRFEIFEQNICSILPLLEAKNIPIKRVDGVGPIGEVTDRLVDVVKELNPDATEQNDDVNGEEIEKSYGE
ncbi:nucleoside monophosphate kinase [Candidatus Saccharibacteria bacterium]|nr:nucleoside monophosphate kinase [Candidatus Saccharibacteria bacterium]MBQ1539990.1 nucleoside monophosphate kinase [Candidatus Saccharibacteria bacterium]